MLSNVDKLAALFVINKKLSQEGRKDELQKIKFKFIKSFLDLEQIIDTYLPSYTVRYLDRWNNTMEAVRKYIKKGLVELIYHNKPEAASLPMSLLTNQPILYLCPLLKRLTLK